MKTTFIEDGYIEDVIAPDHYYGCVIRKDVVQQDRDWRPYLGAGERQSTPTVETYNCTAFATHNAQEAYMKRVYGIDVNWSDRYLGARAGTGTGGNSPHTVAEVQRKYAGCIPEGAFAFGDNIQSIDDYYSGILWAHKLLGARHVLRWDMQHEWVLNGNETNWQDILYDALLFSPVGIAVQAWTEDGGTYVRTGSDTHWTTLVGARKGRYLVVADSYEPFIKKLDWNYGFTRAKQYIIKPRDYIGPQTVLRVGQGLTGLYA